MSREAMQMALEALESVTGHFTRTPSTLRDSEVRGEAHKAITVLRQALETEQEPVLWLKTWSDGSVDVLKIKSHLFADHELEPLYAAPPKREWVWLTDEEIYDCEEEVGMPQYEISSADLYAFARAIEQALKKKNKW